MRQSMIVKAASLAAAAVLVSASVSNAQQLRLAKAAEINLATFFVGGATPGLNGSNPSAVAFDGNSAYISGFNSSAGANSVGVVKIDNLLGGSATVTELPGTRFTSNANVGIQGLVADANGLYMTHDSGTGGTGFIRKFDLNGNQLWNVPSSNISGSYRPGAIDIDPLGDNGSPMLGTLGIGSGRRVGIRMSDGTVIYDASAGAIVSTPTTGFTHRGVAFDSAGNVASLAQLGVDSATRNTVGGTDFNKWDNLIAAGTKSSNINPIQDVAFIPGLTAGDDLMLLSVRPDGAADLPFTFTDSTATAQSGLDSRHVLIRQRNGTTGALTQLSLTGAEDGGTAYTSNLKGLATGRDASGAPVLLVVSFAEKRLDLYRVESEWNVAAGSWSSAGSWFGPVADGATASARLGNLPGAPAAIDLDSTRTLRKLTIDSANSYTVNGAGSLNVSGFTDGTTVVTPGLIEVVSGSHTINVPINLQVNSRIVVNAGATLTHTAQLGASGRGLTKRGDGTLVLRNLRASAVNLEGGETRIAPNATNDGVSRVGGINFTGGTLNLTNNALIVDYATTSPIAGLRDAFLVNNTLTSSLLNSNTSIGIVEASDLAVTTFGGFTVDATAVIAKYTLKGDSDLSGSVDFVDLVAMARNYSAASGAGWHQGDTDYNGTVDFVDLVALARNYNSAILPSGEILLGDSSTFAADWALAQSMVPEPATLGLLAAGTLLLARRRR